jgi:hypothetical protein
MTTTLETPIYCRGILPIGGTCPKRGECQRWTRLCNNEQQCIPMGLCAQSQCVMWPFFVRDALAEADNLPNMV